MNGNSLAVAILTRRGLLGMGAVGAAIGLVGCSSSGTPTPASSSTGAPALTDATKALTVALWGDAVRAKLYQSAIDLYKTKNPDTALTLQYADLTAYLERLATQAAASSLPDVFFMRDTHISRYGSSGVLLNLEPYLNNGIDKTGIGDDGVFSGKLKNGVFALPTHYVGSAVIYDDTALKTAGVNYANDVKTWDDLAAAAKEVSGKGFYGIADPTIGSTHNHFESYVRQAGGEVYNADGTEAGFKNSVMEDWFAYWDKMRKAGTVPPADVETEAESAGWTKDLLTTGRAGFRLASTNHLTLIQNLRPTPLGMDVMPALADGTKDWRFFPPILMSIAAKTKGGKTSVALMDYFINNPEAAALTRLSQGAPSSSKVRDSLLPSLNPQEKRFIEVISSELNQPRRPAQIRPAGAESFNKAITQTGQQIAFGSASIKDAVANFMSEAKRALKA